MKGRRGRRGRRGRDVEVEGVEPMRHVAEEKSIPRRSIVEKIIPDRCAKKEEFM